LVEQEAASKRLQVQKVFQGDENGKSWKVLVNCLTPRSSKKANIDNLIIIQQEAG
jgi:hypothetical protein